MTRATKPYLFLAPGAIALLAAGLAIGAWWARRDARVDTPATTKAPARKVLYWYDPMAPEQHFAKPGKSPLMDMPLLPKYADEDTTTGVRIAPQVRQNLGIRTAVVETDTLAGELRVPATLAWDLREEAVVSARVEGIVTRVFVKAPFEAVHRGQALASLLSPEWSTAQAEAQALRAASSPSARALQGAAQQRLRVLGAPGRGGAGGAVLSAPRDGIVSEVLVREGQAVVPGTPLFRINGLATLWLEAAIPQAGAAAIAPGTPVEATVDALPGETFSGEVEALLPLVDPNTRTQRARIVLRNPDRRLAPGMFAQLRLQPVGGRAVALLPTEALIATGTDSRVIVVAGDGTFQPVRVRTGRSSGGRTEILAGLRGGERVVTSGQFLIDSEASLSGALQRLPQEAGEDASATPPSHEGDAHAPSPAHDANAHAPASPKPASQQRKGALPAHPGDAHAPAPAAPSSQQRVLPAATHDASAHAPAPAPAPAPAATPAPAHDMRAHPPAAIDAANATDPAHDPHGAHTAHDANATPEPTR